MNNKKKTRGRNFYYQRVNKNVPIYDRRIVGIRNKWYHKILLFLRLMSRSKIAIRKSVVVDYKLVPTNRVIKHKIRSQTSIMVEKVLEKRFATG
jgi:hypothetical protein